MVLFCEPHPCRFGFEVLWVSISRYAIINMRPPDAGQIRAKTSRASARASYRPACVRVSVCVNAHAHVHSWYLRRSWLSAWLLLEWGKTRKPTFCVFFSFSEKTWRGEEEERGWWWEGSCMPDVIACAEEYRLYCQPGVSLMKIGIQALRGELCERSSKGEERTSSSPVLLWAKSN
ncbi:unnamed protein product, partial [Gadus morhua 'NCC']